MRKILLLFFVSFMFSGLYAQNVIYEDNFDSYTAGEYLALQSDDWTTWTMNPGGSDDGYVVDEESNTAPNSVKVEGGTDLIYQTGNFTSGVYALSMNIFVPSGFGGYYNIEHFDEPGVEWALEVYFSETGNGYVNAGGSDAATFTHPLDEWFNCETVIDLNSDWATLYIGGVMVHEWQWSLEATGPQGTNQLGCVDMYAGAPDGETATYYFDDFKFEEVATPIYEGNFDEYTAGDYLAVVDDAWTTWTMNPGGSDDGFIVDEEAFSAPNSVKVEGGTDLIFQTGNFTSGSYQLDFQVFIPSGFGGYFNIEHFDEPGVEWALEVYFSETGNGYVNAGGSDAATFTHALDTWFSVVTIIDLDADWAELYINDELVHEWQWSLEATGPQGTNQLGCVDMYAGAPDGETATYYFDNFNFWSLSSALAPPTVDIDVDEIVVEINDGIATMETFSVMNIGEQNLDYFVYPIYDVTAATGTTEGSIQYCTDNVDAVSWTNPGVWTAAVAFTPEKIQDHISTELTSVDIYINDPAVEMKVKIWAKGSSTTPGPGELIYSQDFTAVGTSWNTVVLNEPLLLDGDMIWVGYSYFQPASTWVAGFDAGPADPNGAWVSSGVGWFQLSDAGLDGNWNIIANTTGDPMPAFMDVPVDMGVVLPADGETVGVFFSPDGLDAGQYTGQIVVATNDPVTNYAYIAATLDIVTGTSDINKTDAVVLYPNPTSDVVNLRADASISMVKIANYLGQTVNVIEMNETQTSIDMSQYNDGVYFLEITTAEGQHTIKVVKK